MESSARTKPLLSVITRSRIQIRIREWLQVVISAMFGDRMAIQVTVTNIYDVTPYLAERF